MKSDPTWGMKSELQFIKGLGGFKIEDNVPIRVPKEHIIKTLRKYFDTLCTRQRWFHGICVPILEEAVLNRIRGLSEEIQKRKAGDE